MSELLTIVVRGSPAPAGSKRYVGTTKAGRGILVESSAKVKPWRSDVRDAAMAAIGDAPPMDGPLSVCMTFTLPKPKSANKRARTWPDKKPDLSKLVRSTEDAITDAGVWADDARVVEMLARKVFPEEGQDALSSPGAVVRISRVDP